MKTTKNDKAANAPALPITITLPYSGRQHTIATREDAIAALVEMDVGRWGDSEREASQRMHSARSLGLALNEIWARYELAGELADEIRKAAQAALTSADRAALRKGG